MTVNIHAERLKDAGLIEPLLDRTFGFERAGKTVYRLRERLEPVAGLRFVAVHSDGGLLGSLRFWPILIRTAPAILLGPLAVEPALQGQGIGKALLHHGLARARRSGHSLCVVVGDPNYYRPFGFVNAASLGLVLPGPVELPRFQVMELAPGALDGVFGLITRAESGSGDGGYLRGDAVA